MRRKASNLACGLILAGACGACWADGPVPLTADQLDRVTAGQAGEFEDRIDFTERLNTVFAELQNLRAIGFFNNLTSGVSDFSAIAKFSSLSSNIAGFSISLSPRPAAANLRN